MSKECSICLEESDDLIVVKPCKHEFHLYCIKKIVRPSCPMCKCDISKFLTTNKIVSKEELLKRCDQDDIRIINQMDDILESDSEDDDSESNSNSSTLDDEHIDQILEQVDGLTNEEIIQKCLANAEFEFDYDYDCSVYMDILLSKIHDTCETFLQISNIKAYNNKKGFFLYEYDSLEKFITQQVNGEKSVAKFVPISDIGKFIQNRSHITKINANFNKMSDDELIHSNVFLVVVRFDDSLSALPFPQFTDWYNIPDRRLGHKEVIASLLDDILLTYDNIDTQNEPNQEHKWAKNYLQPLKQKNKDFFKEHAEHAKFTQELIQESLKKELDDHIEYIVKHELSKRDDSFDSLEDFLDSVNYCYEIRFIIDDKTYSYDIDSSNMDIILFKSHYNGYVGDKLWLAKFINPKASDYEIHLLNDRKTMIFSHSHDIVFLMREMYNNLVDLFEYKIEPLLEHDHYIGFYESGGKHSFLYKIIKQESNILYQAVINNVPTEKKGDGIWLSKFLYNFLMNFDIIIGTKTEVKHEFEGSIRDYFVNIKNGALRSSKCSYLASLDDKIVEKLESKDDVECVIGTYKQLSDFLQTYIEPKIVSEAHIALASITNHMYRYIVEKIDDKFRYQTNTKYIGDSTSVSNFITPKIVNAFSLIFRNVVNPERIEFYHFRIFRKGDEIKVVKINSEACKEYSITEFETGDEMENIPKNVFFM